MSLHAQFGITYGVDLPSSPGPFPAFQCCMLAEKQERHEKIGIGLETRLSIDLHYTLTHIMVGAVTVSPSLCFVTPLSVLDS